MNLGSGFVVFLAILISDLQLESAGKSVNSETFSDCGLDTSVGVDSTIGGKEVKRGEFPWHLGVYDYASGSDTPSQICGATILTRKIAISAAHCFWNVHTNKILPANLYTVAAGKLYRDYDNTEDEKYSHVQFSEIDKILVPKEYYGSEQQQQSDIALLVLARLLDFSNSVMPICFDLFDSTFDKTQTDTGVIGKGAGWGVTVEGGASPVLKTVELPIVDYTECRNKMPTEWRRFLTNDKFCAGYLNGTGMCSGDSGGGLVFKSTERGQDRWYLRGLVSVGVPSETSDTCRANTYTGFTRVFLHSEWINENLEKYARRFIFK